MFISLLIATLSPASAESACVIPVFVNYDSVPPSHGDTFVPALDRAIENWNEVTQPIRLERQRESRVDEPYGSIHVTWGKVTQNAPGGVKMASTFVSVDLEDRVDRARIVMDTGGTWCDNNTDDCFKIDEILLHEVGHALGLKHIEDPTAVMYANVYRHIHKNKLTQVDVELVKKAMPAGSATCSTSSGHLSWSRFTM